MMGSFIKSIPQAVIITILASLVISLMITPTLCSRFLPKQKEKKQVRGQTLGPCWIRNPSGSTLWLRI